MRHCCSSPLHAVFWTLSFSYKKADIVRYKIMHSCLSWLWYSYRFKKKNNNNKIKIWCWLGPFHFADIFTCTKMLYNRIKERQKPDKKNITSLSVCASDHVSCGYTSIIPKTENRISSSEGIGPKGHLLNSIKLVALTIENTSLKLSIHDLQQ